MWGRLELLAWVENRSGEDEVVVGGDIGAGGEEVGGYREGEGEGVGEDGCGFFFINNNILLIFVI